MLKGYKILTSFCVICATLYGGAYGAASVRGGATSRAGSIRTLGAGTTASVKTMTSRTQPTTTAANANTESTESVGGMRMSHATGLGGSKLPGKISGTTTSTSGDNQNVAELRQAIEQLRNDYDALGEQYNNLLGDVSNVSDTAQVAHETATNNTNTLTVVRSDLSVAKSDIEDLKATGGFDEERVQEALDTTLAQRNYATRGELAATDAVARGAVQVADLPQTLNALNIADKDYVASRTQGVVNDSLNITLENYYTKGQVNAAIDVAKTGMVDKQYVDHMVDGLAAKTYVDNRVASIQTGVTEGAVQGIIDNSIDTRLGNYYTKDYIDNAIGDAIDAAKDGMADRDFVNTQVRDTMQYVDEKVAEKESGVDAGTLYNILETRGYKTGTEVQGIVNDSINNTMANYYTKDQVENAIDTAKKRMVDKNYVDFLVDGLVDENRVNTIVNTKIATLPLGLDRDAVKAVVEGYGYKDDAAVREMIDTSGHVKTSELPDLIKQWAPGAEIQYADGKLYFVDKDGNDRVVDIRGLDGQDGAQVEIRQNDGWIQWHYEGDTEWNNLVAMSDLKGADGESVKLDVQSMNGYKNALVYSKENESNWQFLYSLDDIKGADGCGVRAETTNTANGIMVKLLKDCAGQTGDGQLLTQFEVLNGVDGTVTEEQIVDALKSNPEFVQLKTQVNDLSNGLNNTNSQVNELSDRVDNNTTGLAATNTLANNAWDKVKDLGAGVTAKGYIDGAIGFLGTNPYTAQGFASVAAKLGDISPVKTVAEYINDQVSKVNTSIQVKRGVDGNTYICKTGNNCTGEPNQYSDDWARISVDVSGYLTKNDADALYASSSLVGAVATVQDAATQAQTQASQAWSKLSDLGNLTVKDYVDNYFDNTIGFLGTNLLSGKNYSVADKIGIYGNDTVKKYIDDAVAGVNTKIQVAQGVDGRTYICKNGNTCTGYPSMYSDEWVPITVDMSGYLTENDANKLYAPIGTVTIANDAKTIANEAKTAATAAQTNATQAQNAASAAQSTANDAWGKLSDLGNTTVREFVEDKVSGLGTTIDVRTDGGTTYICKIGKCLDTPPSSYWEPITVTISDEYLTEAEGDVRYAPKAEYALKSYVDGNIGVLGGSFTSVGDKIGLNAGTDYTKSVKQYVDDKFGSISTTIQVETGTDGFTYICKNGNNCHLPIATYPSEWAKVNVDLGNLGTNSYGQSYNVAQKIGLTDSTNINKTVVGYIGDQIGELGNYYDATTYGYKPYNVKKYLEDTYVPKTTVGDLGSNGSANYTVAQKIGLDTADTKNTTVKMYVDNRVGNLGMYWDSSSYQSVPYTSVKQYVDDKFALKANIGTLGGDFTNVGDKIGLNSTNDTTNSAKTVKQYIDGLIGNLGGSFTSVAAKLGLPSGYSDKTIAEYVEDYVAANAASGGVTVGTFEVGGENKTYICSDNCTTTPPCVYPTACGWQELDIDVSSKAEQSDMTAVQNILAGFGTGTGNWGTVKGYIGEMGSYKNSYLQDVNYTVETKIGLNTDETKNKSVTQYIADKLGFTGDNANKTVAEYIVAYVAEHAASGGVTVQTITNNGVSETYICSKNCESTPPCQVSDTPDTCGWQKLEVDLSQYLKSSDAASIYLPWANLKLVRDGADIHLKQVNSDDDIKDYGIVAGVQDLMCRSYRTEPVEPGVDGCPASGSACYKMICNTNGND